MPKPNSQFILAVDTSCDETSASVTCGTVVLSNVVASQVELHKQYGGVFPTVAKLAHQENLEPVIKKALQQSGLGWEDLDGLAVTLGPGLAPALEVGIQGLEKLATQHKLPLKVVNHIEGHVLSVLAQALPKNLQKKDKTSLKNTSVKLSQELLQGIKFPTLAVIISGKHTDFILVRGLGEYERLGWTVDDAAGECLDKVGRMLDLGYPAGSIIEEFAHKGNADIFDFPLPMTTSGDFNLSFSGLKTHSRNLIAKIESEQEQPFNKQQVYDFCAALQTGVFRHITHKLEKILKAHPEIQEVWLGGGVAANATLRKTLRQQLKKFAKDHQTSTLPLRTPYSKKLCGDNGAMIGLAAGLGSDQSQITKLDRKPRWKVGE